MCHTEIGSFIVSAGMVIPEDCARKFHHVRRDHVKMKLAASIKEIVITIDIIFTFM